MLYKQALEIACRWPLFDQNPNLQSLMHASYGWLYVYKVQGKTRFVERKHGKVLLNSNATHREGEIFSFRKNDLLLTYWSNCLYGRRQAKTILSVEMAKTTNDPDSSAITYLSCAPTLNSCCLGTSLWVRELYYTEYHLKTTLYSLNNIPFLENY